MSFDVLVWECFWLLVIGCWLVFVVFGEYCDLVCLVELVW